MPRLLLSGLDNSWSIVFVSSLGNHAPPVVMKVTQWLEHDECYVCGELSYACCYESYSTAGAWYMFVLWGIRLRLLL